MRNIIKVYKLVLFSLFVFSILSCARKNNELKFIVEGSILTQECKYNPNGFVDSPYGRAIIDTKSYFRNDKLIHLLWNRANGFLDHSIDVLRNDPKFFKSLNIDSLYSKNIEKYRNYKTRITRNDTIFILSNNKEKIYLIN